MYHNTDGNVIYPNHKRTPNVLVRGLYKLGFFIGDFGPLLVNLFNVIYGTVRKLFAFLIGLLIEISTVIVLIGTIAFSVVHSLELLRRGGAVGGLEYIGVIMFEVVFISSVAVMTRCLMNREKPNPYSLAGFVIGFLFVEWSNITGMAQNWSGWIIGFFAPILLIITEGIIAFQYRKPESEMVTKMDEKRIENEPKLVAEMVEKMVTNEAEKSMKPEPEMAKEIEKKETKKSGSDSTILKETEKKNETDESVRTLEESRGISDEAKPEFGENRKLPDEEQEPKMEEKQNQDLNQNSGEMVSETEPEMEPETDQTEYQNGNQSETENGENPVPESNQKSDEIQTKTEPSKPKDEDDPETKKMRRNAKRWATKFYRETGKIPGRVRIAKYANCDDSIARDVAKELKEKYGKKQAS